MSKTKDIAEHYEFYRVADGDQFDIGFKVKGFAFRFINPRKQERSQDRPWKPLTKADLPENFVKVLLEKRPNFFGDDGLHRRMGENVLAFCKQDIYSEVQRSLQKRNREDMERILNGKNLEGGVTTQASLEAPEDYSQLFKK
jgi:hypothetical protein